MEVWKKLEEPCRWSHDDTKPFEESALSNSLSVVSKEGAYIGFTSSARPQPAVVVTSHEVKVNFVNDKARGRVTCLLNT